MLLRETFPVGAFQCNCTVLACGDTKDAVVIDPGGEVERIAQLVAHYDLTVRAIVHTHAHLDHIYCTRDVKEAHGGEVCLHPGDRFLYDGFAMQAADVRLEAAAVRAGRPLARRRRQHRLRQAYRPRAPHPGHTPGSVCFEVTSPGDRPLVFAGDTLFRRSIGRTDLPGGDSAPCTRRSRSACYTRDLDAVVVPGHGPTTTLGDEARSNPWVRATSP